jgi:hypothetical protein
VVSCLDQSFVLVGRPLAGQVLIQVEVEKVWEAKVEEA